MANSSILILLCALFCLALSFLFSGMEAGVFALSRLRIRQQMRAGRPRAQVLHGFLANPENFLWTILVGNTLSNFVVVSLVVSGLHGWLWVTGHPVWFFGLLLGAVFGLYAAGDLLPKMLFRSFPNRLCLALAVPFRFVHLLLSPVVSLMELISNGLLRLTGGKIFTGHLFGSRDELRQVMQDSAQSLTSEERLMINRVLDLQNLTVRQVAVPLTKVIGVTTRTPIRDLLNLYRTGRPTRLPVWQEDGPHRRIVGIVSLEMLLYRPDLDATKTVGDYVRPAIYLDDELRLEEAFRRMQKGGQRLAIVLGRDRRELGIVSLQDILRTIFGEVSL